MQNIFSILHLQLFRLLYHSLSSNQKTYKESRSALLQTGSTRHMPNDVHVSINLLPNIWYPARIPTCVSRFLSHLYPDKDSICARDNVNCSARALCSSFKLARRSPSNGICSLTSFTPFLILRRSIFVFLPDTLLKSVARYLSPVAGAGPLVTASQQ